MKFKYEKKRRSVNWWEKIRYTRQINNVKREIMWYYRKENFCYWWETFRIKKKEFNIEKKIFLKLEIENFLLLKEEILFMKGQICSWIRKKKINTKKLKMKQEIKRFFHRSLSFILSVFILVVVVVRNVTKEKKSHYFDCFWIANETKMRKT